MQIGSNRLPIPDSAKADPNATEVVSVWVAAGNQHVTLNPHAWEDPAAWGLLLVDLARHVANAYGQSGVMDSGDALDRIRQGFDAEWSSPTDVASGGLV